MKHAMRSEDAAGLVTDGLTLLVGGFMGVGSPHRLIGAIERRGTRDLTVVCNDLCTPEGASAGWWFPARCAAQSSSISA